MSYTSRSAPGSAAYMTANALDAMPPRDREIELQTIAKARANARQIDPDHADEVLDILGIPDPLPRRS